MKAITPDELGAFKTATLPEPVMRAWNTLISNAFDGRSAVVKQPDAKAALRAAMGVTDVPVAWLNIEPVFIAAGWTVEYEKPGWNESGDATFTFRPRKKS